MPAKSKNRSFWLGDLAAGVDELAGRRTKQLTALGITREFTVSDVIREGVEKLLAAEGLAPDKRAKPDTARQEGASR